MDRAADVAQDRVRAADAAQREDRAVDAVWGVVAEALVPAVSASVQIAVQLFRISKACLALN